MDNIELLKQENEKLNARLAKAVEVFKEQKANIESITYDKEELIKKNDALNSKNEELKEAYAKTLAEIKELTKELAEVKTQLHNQENIVNQEADYEELRKKYETRKEQQAELLGQIDELNKQYESKDQAYKILQDTYNKLVDENTKQKTELIQAITLYEEAKLEIDEVKQVNSECVKENEDLKVQLEQKNQELNSVENNLKQEIKKLTDAHEEVIHKCTELYKINEELQKSVTEYKEAYEGQKKENKETEEQFDRVLKSFEDDLTKKKQELEQAELDKKDLTITITDLTEKLSATTNSQTKYEEFARMILELADSFNNNGNNIDKSTKIQETQIKKIVQNSTGNQFMADAPGMNI